MAQYEYNPAAINPEAIRDLMRQVGGTNLAGQSMAGPVATGQAYAQQIAGGMPMEQVIAPGVSYSPEMAGGYTQKDLDMIAAGPAPVMPVAPTTGEVATIEDQMPYAPPGVQEPTRFMPFLQNLDFSNLPRYNLPRYEDIRDIRSYEDIRPTLFDIDVEEILKDIDTEKFEDIDFSNIDIPSVAPMMPELPDFNFNTSNIPTTESFSESPDFMPGSGIGGGVATDKESLIGKTLFGQTITPESFAGRETAKSSFLSAVPRPDLPIPNISGPFGFMNKPTPAPVIPQVPAQEPMNFTGLPQTPVMPQIAYTPPVPSFVQPQIEDIVSPIRAGSLRNFQQPGLFSF